MEGVRVVGRMLHGGQERSLDRRGCARYTGTPHLHKLAAPDEMYRDSRKQAGAPRLYVTGANLTNAPLLQCLPTQSETQRAYSLDQIFTVDRSARIYVCDRKEEICQAIYFSCVFRCVRASPIDKCATSCRLHTRKSGRLQGTNPQFMRLFSGFVSFETPIQVERQIARSRYVVLSFCVHPPSAFVSLLLSRGASDWSTYLHSQPWLPASRASTIS